MTKDLQQRVTPGIPDELFERGDVPLTKQEIRALTLCKLQLSAEHRVIDIGAGSGGLSIECAALLKNGRVWAVERDPEALKLIKANCRRFGLQNVEIIAGEAPEALAGLEPADRIIIGGSGGRLAEIIARTKALLRPGGLLIINCILIETLAESLRLLADHRFKDIAFIQAAISRSRRLGEGTALQPLNPVYIVTAAGGES